MKRGLTKIMKADRKEEMLSKDQIGKIINRIGESFMFVQGRMCWKKMGETSAGP